MRLLDIEEPLREAIRSYIKEVYPYTKGEVPDIRVLDFYEAGEKSGVDGIKSFYNIPSNTIYFSDRPTPRSVAHEIEHWAQAQRVGSRKYMEQLGDPKNWMDYEAAAMDVALANAPRLRW